MRGSCKRYPTYHPTPPPPPPPRTCRSYPHDSTLLFAVNTDQKTSGLSYKRVWTYILSMSSFSSRAPGRSLLLPRTKTWRHTGGTHIREHNSRQSLCSQCKPEGNFLFLIQQQVVSSNAYIGFKHQQKNTFEDATGAERHKNTELCDCAEVTQQPPKLQNFHHTGFPSHISWRLLIVQRYGNKPVIFFGLFCSQCQVQYLVSVARLWLFVQLALVKSGPNCSVRWI